MFRGSRLVTRSHDVPFRKGEAVEFVWVENWSNLESCDFIIYRFIHEGENSTIREIIARNSILTITIEYWSRTGEFFTYETNNPDNCVNSNSEFRNFRLEREKEKRISPKASSREGAISRKRGVHNAICHAAAGNCSAKEWDRREVGDRVRAEIDSRIFLCEAPFDNPRAVLWLPPAVTVTRNAWISTIPWCVYTQLRALYRWTRERESKIRDQSAAKSERDSRKFTALPSLPIVFSFLPSRDNFSPRPLSVSLFIGPSYWQMMLFTDRDTRAINAPSTSNQLALSPSRHLRANYNRR